MFFSKNKKKCKKHPRFELQKQSGPEIAAVASPRRSSGRGHDLPPQGCAGVRGRASPRRRQGSRRRCGRRRQPEVRRRWTEVWSEEVVAATAAGGRVVGGGNGDF